MSPLEWAKRESALISRHPWEFATCAVIALGLGFGVASFLDAGEISLVRQQAVTAGQDRDLARNCRASSAAMPPCPVIYLKKPQVIVKTIYVPTSPNVTSMEAAPKPAPSKPIKLTAGAPASIGKCETGSGCSIGQQGGVTAGSVTVGMVPRQLSQENKQYLLDNISKDQVVHSAYMSSAFDGEQVIEEIIAFLKASGYTHVDTGYDLAFGFGHGVVLTKNKDGSASILVGPKFYRMNNVLVPRMGGGCRFMPPTPQVVGMEAHPMGQRPITMAFWPAVGETDWCGQWAPNKVKADA